MEKIRWQKMVEDTKKFFTSPAELYQNFEKKGGYLEPLVYVISIYLLFCIPLFLIFFPIYKAHSVRIFHIASGFLMLLVLVPIQVIIGSFVVSLIFYFIWRFLGSAEDFETSFRCIASFSPLIFVKMIIGIIPFFGRWVGGIACIFIAYYYIVLASVYVHNVDKERARKIFMVIAVILSVINVIGNVKLAVWERQTRRKQEEIDRQMKEYEKKWQDYEKQMEELYKKQMEEYKKQNEEYNTGYNNTYPAQPPQGVPPVE